MLFIAYVGCTLVQSTASRVGIHPPHPADLQRLPPEVPLVPAVVRVEAGRGQGVRLCLAGGVARGSV